jgi:hypothetical protein
MLELDKFQLSDDTDDGLRLDFQIEFFRSRTEYGGAAQSRVTKSNLAELAAMDAATESTSRISE